MKSVLVKSGLPLVIVFVAVAIAAVMIMSKKPPEKAEIKQKAFLVSTTTVEVQDINYVVKSQGTVQPKIETTLSAQVSGKVVAVSDAFIEGGMFSKGDVLIQLEQDDYITDLKSAEAELARAKAALEEEQARGKVAAEEWRSVKNSVAPELGLRKPQLAKEMANVRAVEAQLERAKRNLERTVIRAPYDGLVKSKDVDMGQFVGTGTKVGHVYSTDVAEVRMPLTDNDLAYLNLDATSQLPEVLLKSRVAGKNVTWRASLARDEGVLDAQSRVIYAIAEVNDPYLRKQGNHDTPLRYGRFVEASITGNRGENIAVLPRHVLRLDGTVLVVKQDRKLEVVSVNVQRADETSIYISEGLNRGDLVAISAVPNAYDGMLVRLKGDEEGDSATASVAQNVASGGE